jgi:calcineurin-like phosphoesterase family protein
MYKQITLQPNQNIYFTSDPHYDHLNICSATTKWKDSNDVTRKFKSIDHMNTTIVNSINSKFTNENDILICLGDWSFNGFDNIALFRSKLLFKTIYIIPGNHDEHIIKNKNNIRNIFTDVWEQITVLNIKEKISNGVNTKMYKKYNTVLSHYPQCSWIDMSKGFYHLHGHVHLPPKHKLGQGKSLDVGVDGNNYIPYSIHEIDKLLSKQPIKKLSLPHDHHESNK